MLALGILLLQVICVQPGQGSENQCYDELGCFSVDYPWTSLLRPFPPPLPPQEINISLSCYSRTTPERNVVVLWPSISLRGCQFSANKKTVFITHGFASNGDFPWLSEMKDRYLKLVDANVFIVDWGRGAQMLNYLQVASNTRVVGAEIIRFIKFLQADNGLDPANLHLIGHSLGAHIFSYVAKAVPRVAHLTALDPAQPGFEGNDKEVRLDEGDAIFIDVIHTNGAPFIPTLGVGMMMPCGHVDFYMNGGLMQPNCKIPNFTSIHSIDDLAKFTVETLIDFVCCSHCRAFDYYNQALESNCTIWGQLASFPTRILNAATMGFIQPLISSLYDCDADSCTQLGLQTPKFKARGVFAVSTPMVPPFCDDDTVTKDLMSRIGDAFFANGQRIWDAMMGSMNKNLDFALGIMKSHCLLGICI